MSQTLRLAASVGLAAALAGCASLNPFAKKETRPCPNLVVLRDAGHLTQYRPGEGRDLLDVRYTVDIADISGRCKYARDTLEMTVNVDLIFTRGPAAEGAKMQAPFFVAVTRNGDDILAKKVFDSAIEFPDNRRRAGVREEVDQYIKLQPEETGAAYEIIIGLQVSEEQLTRNRQR